MICKLFRHAIVLTAMSLAGCGGDDPDPPPVVGNDSPFQLKAYFENVIRQGASYSLIGTFTDGAGQISEQRHDQVRFPSTSFAGPWQGLQNIQRTVIQVDRYVNGQVGKSDTYSSYYDSDLSYLGLQTAGETEFQLLLTRENRPVSAKIGESGSIHRVGMYPDEGQNPTGFRDRTWEMTTNAAGDPVYCEDTRELNLAGLQVWEYRWCYGLTQNGTPTSFASFSFDAGQGSVGSLVANNFTSPPSGTLPPPPPPTNEPQPEIDPNVRDGAF